MKDETEFFNDSSEDLNNDLDLFADSENEDSDNPEEPLDLFESSFSSEELSENDNLDLFSEDSLDLFSEDAINESDSFEEEAIEYEIITKVEGKYYGTPSEFTDIRCIEERFLSELVMEPWLMDQE